jgi:D-glycero-alpha-D-manno-heptose-7-phosphate kinase
MISVKKILEQDHFSVSAPCRIDSGGTWDIKAMALPFDAIKPVTVNIALNLRTTVELLPFEDKYIKISSQGFDFAQVFSIKDLPLTPPFGLFCAAVSCFGLHGLEIRIRSQSPVKSALGGSSTALAALVKALSDLLIQLGFKKKMPRKDILYLAYHLEDAVSGGRCGFQDQAAAVFGGVNQWNWRYKDRVSPYERVPLLDRKGQKKLSERLLVAYSGTTHVSAQTNRDWVQDFFSGKTRAGWVKVNEIVKKFATSVMEQDWKRAVSYLKGEMNLRRELTPEALTPVTLTLINQAQDKKCGARFSGAGAGGCVWSIGEACDVRQVKKVWAKTLEPIEGATLLDCEVDPDGVK